MFDEPGSTGGGILVPRDIVDHLLIIWSVEYIAHSETKFSRPDKPSDAIIVDAVDLDQPDASTGQEGQLFQRVWWRNSRLIQALRPKAGSKQPMLAWMVVGRATMGNPPFELQSATSDPAAVARAQRWIRANPQFTPSLPRTVEPSMTVQPAVTQPQVREESVLERMARQSTQPVPYGFGPGTVPPPRPPQQEQPPF